MKKTAGIFIFLLFVPLILSAGGQVEADTGQTVTGVVEYLDGEVSINGEPADFGMKVPYGATVKTGAESYCEIVFEDRNIFRIQELTVAEIKLSTSKPEITVSQGSFAALFTKLDALTSDDYFKVRTGIAAAGVRGTAFFVKVINPEKTYICICNGDLLLSDPEGNSPENLSSGHHKAVYYEMKDGRLSSTAAPLLYHADEDMEKLASHIKETIPWYY